MKSTIEEKFLVRSSDVLENETTEFGPLFEDDALVESELIAVRFDVTRATLGFIFDLRMALVPDGGNVGVMICQEVRSFAWKGDPIAGGRTCWTVLDSETESHPDGYSFRCDTTPGSEAFVTAGKIVFYVGTVEGFDRMPRYTSDSDSMMDSYRPNWQSIFKTVSFAQRGEVITRPLQV
jgi:hypothetical protein